MRLAFFAVATLAGMAASNAQVVHPNQYATAEGVTNNSFPFNYSAGAGRYQQSYDGSQFGGPIAITEIAFRYKADVAYGGGPCDFKMTFATCASPWNALSGTFASNIGTNVSTVFDGVWTIQPFSGDPATPNPFTARLTLTNPYLYDPGTGDLLMDIEMRSSASGSPGGAFARADSNLGVYRVYDNSGNPTSSAGTLGSNGLITEFTSGAISTYGSGCAGAGGFVPTLFMSGSPTLGSQVIMTLDNGLGGSPSVTFISPGQVDLPIGGGCSLLVQFPAFGLAIPLGGSGPGQGSYFLPGIIPFASPTGPTYFQTFVLDPNQVTGFSASNGLRVDIQ